MSRLSLIITILGGIIAVILIVTYPMHQREVLAAGGGTLSDTMHLILAAVDYLLFLLINVFGAMLWILVLSIVLLREEKRPGASR